MAPLENTHFTLFENIAKCQHKDKVKELLIQNDFSGISPWMKTVDSSFTSIDVIEKMVTLYDVSINTTDNMENTALHILSSTDKSKRIEKLITLGIKVNSKNIFGQSAFSRLRSEETFNIFDKCTVVAWDTRDRWNRSPFHEIIFETGVFPALLQKMLQKHNSYIEDVDMWQSTPLHLAAYVGNTRKVKFLMDCTDKRLHLDDMKETAAETALRLWNFECYQQFDNKLTLYIPDQFGISATKLKGHKDIRKSLKDFPEDFNGFSDLLLRAKHEPNSQKVDEEAAIISAVNNLVSRICNAVKHYDPRFAMSVFQTGSTAEGTKIGQPDEFEFALCVETLSQNCEIEIPCNQEQDEFVCLRYKENLGSEYTSFSDENRFFIALPFLHLLFCYIKRALNDVKLWVSGKLFKKPSDTIRVLSGKPVFNFNIYWNGSKYKQLRISIDLVPVVYTRGWWPSFIKINTRTLLSKTVKDAGCFIMLHSKMNEFDMCWHVMNDNIDTTCKRNFESLGKTENKDHLLLRVSIAPAEIALMNSLPKQFQSAYALAKIIKGKDVCPRVKMDDIPPYFDSSFRDNYSRYVIDSFNQIKSYWLKNCRFYIAEETGGKEYNGKTSLDVAILIYEKLLKCATMCQLEAYLFPQSDILKIEKDEAKSTNDVRKLLLMRKVCIDTVLGILGNPYPEDNSEWIQNCEKKYQQYVPTEKELLSQIPSVI